jgi:hypothetical protein
VPGNVGLADAHPAREVGAAVVCILTDAGCAGEVGFRITADGAQPMSAVG